MELLKEGSEIGFSGPFPVYTYNWNIHSIYVSGVLYNEHHLSPLVISEYRGDSFRMSHDILEH